MLQRSARLQYGLLALVAVLALSHFYVGLSNNLRNLVRGQTSPRTPFITTDLTPVVSSMEPEAQAAGLRQGDTVLTVSGERFTGRVVLIAQVRSSHVGAPLAITWTHPGDTGVQSGSIALAPERATPAPFYLWITRSIFLALPLLFLLIGVWVVLARPHNPHAWLILGILGYFDSLFIGYGKFSGGILFAFAIFWNTVAQTAMPLCLMFLGVYFPQHSGLDVRFPWVKWVLTISILAFMPLDLIYYYSDAWKFTAGSWLVRPTYAINFTENVLAALAISWFFATLGVKRAALAGDARRRIVVMLWGASIGLTPLLFLVFYAAYRNVDLGQGIPQWLDISVFVILLLFPLTLAYVVVVQRAMDVRILIRQGTKYAFARGTIVVILALLAIWMIASIVHLIRYPHQHRAVDLIGIIGIIAIFLGFRYPLAKRLQQKIDQRFFREAYSAEQVLSELSDEVRNFTEVTPLLTTITQRIGDTLHVDRIAVFLRSGDAYHLQLATGAPLAPGSLALSATFAVISRLAHARSPEPEPVYRDDPSSWLVDATDAERAALSDLSAELLVPLPGRNRLEGVMALGPKRSEEPYSRTDRQLLQSVATQTGLALENAELFQNLTAEVAHRERISREIEIARDVQQHLFPQVVPSIPGIDLAGHCRQAQAVGGDYYDFFILPAGEGDERLALALGDISGKGISAALLMASLRASLRSAAQLQPGDLGTLMRHVNRLVYESSTSNRYATFFYAELDPATRLLTYVNAGHNPPVILRGSEAIALHSTGTVIGLLPEVSYCRASILLHPGDMLVAFTDGISEAMNAAEEEWGEPRMIAAAQALLARPDCKTTAKQLLDCIFNEADHFTAAAPQHDDMTLLICAVS
ncbi:GAF domain-containing SpoIIE family protein phosphatase [Edaphobacter bradus]|uniref:GAF domain-containing SpoIIE family protein phosphatase n=1 Tax=Edaphobacter bradus TaxID=2259016 RepID=UPI0021DFFA4A|nr:GAF domain-containing SpoIIE family protein phosphatase [Edaphobacter bradus]